MNWKLILMAILSPFFSLSAQIIKESANHYTVTTEYYRLKVSKISGMITSMKVTGSDRELVADTGHYSMFFTEFIQERSDGENTFSYYPPLPSGSITTRLELNTNQYGIISVDWNTGKIDAYWTFVFFQNSPLFRASIKRVVVEDGVYSNAQNCVMYSPDMDGSMIIDYTNTPLLTMGDYDGNYAVNHWQSDGAVGYSPWTTTHSLWTSYDFATPRFLPAMIWRQSQDNIIVGAITTWTSANQRASISYHGGGASHVHPGYAEGQWNWFGKSDAESIYLTSSTEYSMELLFYQNSAHVDTLLKFLEDDLNPNIYTVRKNQDYRVASWGGRTSRNPRYFWKFPQVSTNAITSQRLFRPQAFAIPRSQDGSRDNHLFSMLVFANDGNKRLNIAPNYGIESLYDSVSTVETDSGWVGSRGWTIEGIRHVMSYRTYHNREDIRIDGRVSMNFGNNVDRVTLLFPISRRAFVDQLTNDRQRKVWAIDSILDTISIMISASDSIFLASSNPDTLGVNVFGTVKGESRVFTYSLTLLPGFLRDTDYKSYFVKPIELLRQDTLYFEPSSKYYCLGIDKNDRSLTFQFWVDEAINDINFYAENFYPFELTDEFSGKKYSIVEDMPGYYAIQGEFTKGYYLLSGNAIPQTRIHTYLDIYPNPVRHGNITIQMNHYSDVNGRINIFNIRGALIKKIMIRDYFINKNTLTITLRDLGISSGIYLVNFQVGETNEFHKITYIK